MVFGTWAWVTNGIIIVGFVARVSCRLTPAYSPLQSLDALSFSRVDHGRSRTLFFFPSHYHQGCDRQSPRLQQYCQTRFHSSPRGLVISGLVDSSGSALVGTVWRDPRWVHTVGARRPSNRSYVHHPNFAIYVFLFFSFFTNQTATT